MNKINKYMGKAEDFWNWFKENSSKYSQLNQLVDLDKKEELLNEFLEQLHNYCSNLYFEIGGDQNEPQELIISAAGNVKHFKDVETLVNLAPMLKDWNVIKFKPAMGVDFISVYEGIKLDPQKIWFLPLDNKNNPEALGLRIYFPNYEPRLEKTFISASYQLLDTILGEKSAALDLHHIEVDKVPKDPERTGLIEIVELPKYISWKKNKY